MLLQNFHHLAFLAGFKISTQVFLLFAYARKEPAAAAMELTSFGSVPKHLSHSATAVGRTSEWTLRPNNRDKWFIIPTAYMSECWCLLLGYGSERIFSARENSKEERRTSAESNLTVLSMKYQSESTTLKGGEKIQRKKRAFEDNICYPTRNFAICYATRIAILLSESQMTRKSFIPTTGV